MPSKDVADAMPYVLYAVGIATALYIVFILTRAFYRWRYARANAVLSPEAVASQEIFVHVVPATYSPPDIPHAVLVSPPVPPSAPPFSPTRLSRLYAPPPTDYETHSTANDLALAQALQEQENELYRHARQY